MDDAVYCRLRIKEIFHTLPPKERIVAEFILNSPNDVIHMSMEELARSCGVSLSAIGRLAKNLGYGGFKEMIRLLSNELALESQQGEMKYQEIHPGDPVPEIFRNMCLCEIEAIQNTISVMDIQQLELAVDLLCKAQRIDFYGVGASGLVAEDAHLKFLRINKPTACSSDPHTQRLTIASLQPNDVAVLISYSGETNDILHLAHQLKELNIPIISLTRSSKNTLADLANIHLFSSSTESLIRSGTMTSRISQMVVVDALYTAVCSRMYDQVKPYLDKTQHLSSKWSR